jgi:hypothetical protein
VHISCASRVGLLTWQRRPQATRTAIHPHLYDRLRPAQLGVRHHRVDHHRTRRHARPAHQPAPSTKATRPCCHPSPSPPSRSPCPPARWPDHSASPPPRPGSWPPSPGSPRSTSSPTRGQTSLPLTTRSQTPRRPWPWMSSSPAHHAARCHLGLPAWQAASCGRDAGKSRRPPALPLQQGRPNQFICWRLGERLIGLGQGSWVKAASREWFAEGRADVLRGGPLGQVLGSWSRSAMITSRRCRCAACVAADDHGHADSYQIGCLPGGLR